MIGFTPYAAKAPATAEELLTLPGVETTSLPEQAEELTRELFHWLRTDSFGLLAAIGIGFVLYALFVAVRSYARNRLARNVLFGSWGWVALKVIARTRSFFLMTAAMKIASNLFGAPSAWHSLITFLFTIASAVQGAFWVREFLISLVERRAEQSEGDPAMSSAVGVLSVIINMVVWALAGIILLDNLGVNVTALVAGLGIGGIAIGLAAQGIFSDLFAALSILLDRPFQRGETIQVGGAQGVVGTVENIGLKTTRLRALSGEVVVMSNANLLNQQINNFADFSHRRVVLLIEVIYQTEPGLLESIPDEIERIVNAIPNCRFDRCHLFQFATSALDYELVFQVGKPDLQTMFDARQAVMVAIIRRFAELQIDFAFPSQTSYLAGPDGRIVPPHPEGQQPSRPAHLAGKTRRAGKTAGAD
ncbi:mechanosensitive ion channel family protein [Sandaracinobacter sp. RS1-74]|uniref:mechanosensitive ion channel family protein n=1 Tax=Sandaracinobacteroides sayramensis TaxID=2913411 RepID=UPI001EDBCA93|nr:mechanosensitive ion channel domain-containing protein [Sandaracinobacteroides sayramensis]MCG2841336.1 mechanosensitive ion channel family protein [Sandaracinobacteroides sayramensis]